MYATELGCNLIKVRQLSEDSNALIFISAFHSQEDANSDTYAKGAPWTSLRVGHTKKLDTSGIRALEARTEANAYSFSKEPIFEPSKTTLTSTSTEQKHIRTVREAVH